MTKVLFANGSGCVELLCMEPEVAPLSAEAIATYERTKLGSADPKDAAYVGVGNEYYAVGYLAKVQFHANAGLSQLKYERAIPKTLAAVWVASQYLELGNKFNVAVAVLLPPGEYESASRLEERLPEALMSYKTPTGELNVSLSVFDCKPEGGGIYMMYHKNQGAALKRSTSAVVMVGYRNASVLVSSRGQVSQFKTSELGFVQMVELVIKQTSGQSPTSRLVSAIASSGDEFSPKPLLWLARSTDANERRQDVQKLVEAIKESRATYASMLKSWLSEVLPRELDAVVLCGGTADYLHRELSEHFDWVSVSWHSDIVVPSELDPEGMGNRLADVYGMFLYFLDAMGRKEEEQAEESEEVSHG